MIFFLCMSTLLDVHLHARKGRQIPLDGHEPPCGCWELNSGPLEEHSVLLTAEPPLQPHSESLKKIKLTLS